MTQPFIQFVDATGHQFLVNVSHILDVERVTALTPPGLIIRLVISDKRDRPLEHELRGEEAERAWAALSNMALKIAPDSTSADRDRLRQA